MKAFVHTGIKTWVVEGEDWNVSIQGDIATLWRHRPGRQQDENEPAAVIHVGAGSFILFGDEHPHER